MKKFTKITVATMVIAGLGVTIFFNTEKGNDQAQAKSIDKPSYEETTQPNKEKFVVQKKENDMLLSMPLEASKGAPDGYLLDNKYDLGDIVEVTYLNDDIIKERKIKGEELSNLENKYDREINSILEEGLK
ncbi:hypothetical protein MF621_004012 (plasmid) [Bacillus velezensis]|uniref:hypothetical protein n=1 Tax=Bacillus velezensis TaxID=492670 RepID=UPI0020247888|nr:hypothetical protein [Bacillus velezensis]URJ76471.1 hypothetical protein MF619_004050 [Bacillus velezensis]URJ80427.1 hypothetical protein MF621_004012 [Bacillus velezensis]